jgi:hypothetical protein
MAARIEAVEPSGTDNAQAALGETEISQSALGGQSGDGPEARTVEDSP